MLTLFGKAYKVGLIIIFALNRLHNQLVFCIFLLGFFSVNLILFLHFN